MRGVRSMLAPAALAAVLLLASCGDDSGGSSDGAGSGATTTVATSVAPPVTTAPAGTVAPTTLAPTTTRAPGDIEVRVGVDDASTLGSRVETVPLGSPVKITLVADGDEEYHLHTYDLEQRAAAGVPVVFEFTADRAGEFELESHTTGKLLLTLKVEAR